jgi:hypothetical protein
VRHLRRDAARLMAQVGQEIALKPLTQLLSAPVLSDFEKSGCVAALSTIDDPNVLQTLREIVTGDLPIDCRIEAAGKLGNTSASGGLRGGGRGLYIPARQEVVKLFVNSCALTTKKKSLREQALCKN